jgi:hypothetical protein
MLLDETPVSQGTIVSGFPGTVESISANGTANGIVWSPQVDAFALSGPAILRAYNANDLATPLYSSDQAGPRDTAGGAVKFTTPTITNGLVYLGTQFEVDVYGLLQSSIGGNNAGSGGPVTPDPAARPVPDLAAADGVTERSLPRSLVPLESVAAILAPLAGVTGPIMALDGVSHGAGLGLTVSRPPAATTSRTPLSEGTFQELSGPREGMDSRHIDVVFRLLGSGGVRHRNPGDHEDSDDSAEW